jgi:PHD/YefM family antitoxin component YafN of YafNO toxin-antitoxin module
MEAVLLSYQEYEYLKKIEEIFEQYEIKNIVEIRMGKYDPKNNVSWKNIKEDV